MKYPNYPWKEHFPVSKSDHKKWELNKNEVSLLFWALEKKIVSRQKYFKWALEHYQLPLLDSPFFEYTVMGKDQWTRVKDLREWSREILPVWEWENVAYVGCVEPPKDHKTWDFPHRLVLATDLALKMHWKAVKDFSDLLPKNSSLKTAEKSQPLNQSKAKAPAAHSFLPAEDPHQPSYDPMGEPVRENSSPMEEPIRKASPFMEKPTSSPDNVIPIRQLTKTPVQETSSPALSTNTEIIKLLKKDLLSALPEETKTIFSGILLLENTKDLLYPLEWFGRIQIEDETQSLISLTDTSIFSVLLRGSDYHGFVVENESNKKFFKNINWSVLPKHITAIPILDQNKKVEKIFLGVATKSLSYKKLEDIKKAVLPLFEKEAQKKAA